MCGPQIKSLCYYWVVKKRPLHCNNSFLLFISNQLAFSLLHKQTETNDNIEPQLFCRRLQTSTELSYCRHIYARSVAMLREDEIFHLFIKELPGRLYRISKWLTHKFILISTSVQSFKVSGLPLGNWPTLRHQGFKSTQLSFISYGTTAS